MRGLGVLAEYRTAVIAIGRPLSKLALRTHVTMLDDDVRAVMGWLLA